MHSARNVSRIFRYIFLGTVTFVVNVVTKTMGIGQVDVTGCYFEGLREGLRRPFLKTRSPHWPWVSFLLRVGMASARLVACIPDAAMRSRVACAMAFPAPTRNGTQWLQLSVSGQIASIDENR